MGESDESDTAGREVDHAFGEAVGRLGPRLLAGLDALEQSFRHLHPPAFPQIRALLAPARDALEEALEDFDGVPAPESIADFRDRLERVARLVLEALAGIVDPGPPSEGAARALGAMHRHARAQDALYPLRHVLPPVSAWFAEPFRRDDLAALEAPAASDAGAGTPPRVGLFRSAASGEPGERGHFDLYVPECHDGREAWPLVVALHGGSGNGSDFLWSWLREARSRRCLLLAPTSRGSTWSLDAPAHDGVGLARMVEWVAERWPVDRERVLLTGLSDGATMTLLVGLGEATPFTHLAPVSGVLHPMNFAIGNVERARERPIYLVHGALDWMFPVSLAREAARVLEEAGARLVYREIDDLSHTYPREENARIIEWLDPGRAAPLAT
jgi:phospholipase/carboxylesterase